MTIKKENITIKAGIVGISGYSGVTALEILLKHPNVCVTYVGANSTKGKVDEIWPHLKGKTTLKCSKYNAKKAISLCDVIFLAVPHTTAIKIAPALVEAGKKVIDLSADYRLNSLNDYKKWYGITHTDAKNLKKAVYGLPELYREKIKKAQLIANPGCYPTAAILSLAPLVMARTKSIKSIFIDAKSGVSGAGRKVAEALMHSNVNENFKAYKVLKHQHTPEINQYLSKIASSKISVGFVPHLLPVNNGILETVYLQMTGNVNLNKIVELYKKFYKIEKFVRILKDGNQPQLKNVVGTNYCDIGISIDADLKLIVITSAIDNLVKGAAGQAVQNMNIMFNLKETLGLL